MLDPQTLSQNYQTPQNLTFPKAFDNAFENPKNFSCSPTHFLLTKGMFMGA
jgi:hypothetical protein